METLSLPVDSQNGTRLPVMESFYTIQGEGAFTGKAAWFIRLSGCDVGCHWCDVKDSWKVTTDQWVSTSNISHEAHVSKSPIAVITGGEPAMHNLASLTQELQAKGLRTHIETSGVYKLSGDWHWICFSPKKFKVPEESIYATCHELKVVICNKHDLEWAQEHANKVNAQCQLFLQPEWSKREKVMPLIVEYVKRHPNWKVSLQTHKYMDIP